MRNVILLLLLTSTLACEKVNLKTADYDLPVVEAYLIPGEDIKVIITHQLVYASSDSVEQSLPGLNVLISDGEIEYLMENSGDSVYSNPDIIVEVGKTYKLSFKYNNLTISSETTIPSKPTDLSITSTVLEAFSMSGFIPGQGPPEPPEPATLTWSNPEGSYYMIVFENIEGNPVLINTSDTIRERRFRNEPVQADIQDINPMIFKYYGRHNLILYHLNPEYAALYEQLSSTSLDLATPPSNINNGLGIFTGINSDTILVYLVHSTTCEG